MIFSGITYLPLRTGLLKFLTTSTFLPLVEPPGAQNICVAALQRRPSVELCTSAIICLYPGPERVLIEVKLEYFFWLTSPSTLTCAWSPPPQFTRVSTWYLFVDGINVQFFDVIWTEHEPVAFEPQSAGQLPVVSPESHILSPQLETPDPVIVTDFSCEYSPLASLTLQKIVCVELSLHGEATMYEGFADTNGLVN